MAKHKALRCKNSSLSVKLPPGYTDELKLRHTNIEWRDIVAFRNILVHAYFSIQLEIVWETVTQDVPTLESQIVDILAQEFGEY